MACGSDASGKACLHKADVQLRVTTTAQLNVSKDRESAERVSLSAKSAQGRLETTETQSEARNRGVAQLPASKKGRERLRADLLTRCIG